MRSNPGQVLTRNALLAGALRSSLIGPEFAALSRLAVRISRFFGPAAAVHCFPHAAGEHVGLALLEQRVVIVNSDVLGPEPARVSMGRARDRRRLIVWLGLLAHENGHLDFDLIEIIARASEDGLGPYVELLGEARMEYRQSEKRPHTTRFLTACAADIVTPKIAAATASAQSKRGAGLAGCYLVAREHAGILDAEAVAPARALCRRLLGDVDAGRLEALLEEAVVVADDDWETRRAHAERLRELLDDELAGANLPLDDGAWSESGGSGDGEAGGDGQGGDAWERIVEALRRGSEQAQDRLDKDKPDQRGPRIAQQVAERLRRDRDVANGEEARKRGRGGRQAGAPSGRELPDHLNRPAVMQERVARRRLVNRIQRVRSVRCVRQSEQLPPGRMRGRGAVQLGSELARGAPLRGRPFVRRHHVKGELLRPEALILVDTSGSMAMFEPVLGSVCWVVAGAIRDVRGRVCATAFGDGIGCVLDSDDTLEKVPELRCGGGTSYLGAALSLGRGQVPLTNRRLPRLVVVISDGLWIDDGGERQITALRDDGVPTLHIGVGLEPAGDYGAEQMVCVNDPLDVERVIGDGICDAMWAHLGR